MVDLELSGVILSPTSVTDGQQSRADDDDMRRGSLLSLKSLRPASVMVAVLVVGCLVGLAEGLGSWLSRFGLWMC